MAGGGVPPGPLLMIVLAIERAPRIVTLARVEDESRLVDWLEGCGDERVRKLIADALAIVAEPRP